MRAVARFTPRTGPKPRQCQSCGKSYHRRNQIEVWTSQNPGHNTGWVKQVLRVCLKCQGESQSQRVLMLAQIRLVNRP